MDSASCTSVYFVFQKNENLYKMHEMWVEYASLVSSVVYVLAEIYKYFCTTLWHFAFPDLIYNSTKCSFVLSWAAK